MRNRDEFWAKVWQTGPQQSAISVNRPYCKGFNLQGDNLKIINQLVFKLLYNSMDGKAQGAVGSSKDHGSIIDWLGSTKVFFIDVANQLDLYVKLEKLVLSAFHGATFLADVTAIQLPIDIRVVHPVPPPNYLEKRKAVDFLHTDAWRGEPPDVVNCVLYCAVSGQASHLVVYDVPEGQIDKFESYAGAENEATHLVQSLPEVAIQHVPGEAIFFDAYTPHNTRRNGNEIRISLNFSFRRGDPYETLDERWDRSQQPWSKYWYLPQETTLTFEERCDKELERLAASGRDEPLRWRKDAIQKLMIPRKLEELYAG